jgi:hypothetical protein
MRCQLYARTLAEYGILAQAHNRRRIERPQLSAADFPFDNTLGSGLLVKVDPNRHTVATPDAELFTLIA